MSASDCVVPLTEITLPKHVETKLVLLRLLQWREHESMNAACCGCDTRMQRAPRRSVEKEAGR